MGSLFTKKKPVKKDWIKIEFDIDLKKDTTSQDDRLKEGVYVDDIKEGIVTDNKEQQKQEAEAERVAAFRTAYTSEGAQLVLKEKVMKKFEERFDHGYREAKGSMDHFKVMFIFNGDRERDWLEEYIEGKKKWWIVSEHDRYTTNMTYMFHPKELTQI